MPNRMVIHNTLVSTVSRIRDSTNKHVIQISTDSSRCPIETDVIARIQKLDQQILDYGLMYEKPQFHNTWIFFETLQEDFITACFNDPSNEDNKQVLDSLGLLVSLVLYRLLCLCSNTP